MRLLIASSATGGHIYPALAIAEKLKERCRDAEILFVGAKWEIGKDLVTGAGYPEVAIDVSGFDRKNPFNNIKTVRDLILSSGEIKKILREFCPDVVLGTGGHVAGPVIREAKRAGIPTMIQEQNVIPGVANKLAAKYANRIFVGFGEAAFYFKQKDKVVVSGNPVRADFLKAAEERDVLREKHGVAEKDFCILVFGGSQGAAAINDACIDTACVLADKSDFKMFFVTGKDYYSDVREKLEVLTGVLPDNIRLMSYADAIYELYAVADLIISRAGALTVTEIAMSKKASILIPSPNVTNNHQYYNAKALEDAGAAVIMSDASIEHGGITAEILQLASDPEKILEMGKIAATFAKPDAAEMIVDEILFRAEQKKTR